MPELRAVDPGLWGFAPLLNRFGRDLGFTQFVIGACICLYALMLISDPTSINTSGILNFLSPSPRSLFIFGESGRVPAFSAGRWWTVLTAGWLHAGLLHIFFNLMWIRQLAPPTSEMYGPSRMVIIYTIAGITGFSGRVVGWSFRAHSRRSGIYGRTPGAHFRLARGVGLLRQENGQQHGKPSNEVMGPDDVRFRIHHARSRQLGTPRRVRWRIRRIEIPGSPNRNTWIT